MGAFDLGTWLLQLKNFPLMDRRFYTGVGARATPNWAQELLTATAVLLCNHGYWVRSGAARGADQAVEAGAGNHKEIYLPKRLFNKHPSPLYMPTTAAFELAATIHPAWHNCDQFARQAHARNMHQVLGADLKTPSDFLLCFTLDGALTEADTSSETGGTRSAICLASRNGIPVLNLGNEVHEQMVRDLLANLAQ